MCANKNPSVPSPSSAVIMMARLGLTNYSRGRLIWGCYAIVALPLAALIPLSLSAQGLEGENLRFFFRLWMTTLLPISALLIAYSGVSEEVENGTITYIHSRPIPRWALPCGKMLISWLLAAPAAVLFLTVGAALSGLPFKNAGFFAAVILGSAVYCSMASTAGTLFPKHAVFSSLAVIAFLDMGLSKVPGFTQTLTPSFHMENLASLRPPPTGLSRVFTVTATEPGTSTAALLVLAVLFLMVSIVRSGFWEHRR